MADPRDYAYTPPDQQQAHAPTFLDRARDTLRGIAGSYALGGQGSAINSAFEKAMAIGQGKKGSGDGR